MESKMSNENVDIVKEYGPYLVIASNGYWARGFSLYEAAKGCYIKGRDPVRISAYKANKWINNGVSFDGFSSNWDWSDAAIKLIYDDEGKRNGEIESALIASIKVVAGNAVVSVKNKSVKVEVEDE